MSPGIFAMAMALAAQGGEGTGAAADASGPAWRAALIADGLDDAQRARLAATLSALRVELLPAAEVEHLREELRAHGVDCLVQTTDCLARVTVLADVDRALRVWPAEGALDVLVVDATPRRARARLLHSDPDEGWHSALGAALALAPLDEPVSLPPEPPASPERGAHATVAPAAPVDDGAGTQLVLGAVALGAGGVGLVVSGVLGVLALSSVRASQDAHFQDDVVAHAYDANLRLAIGTGVGAASALVAAAGAALIALDLSEEG